MNIDKSIVSIIVGYIHIYIYINGWMDGWLNGLERTMDRWMDGWMCPDRLSETLPYVNTAQCIDVFCRNTSRKFV